MRDADYETPVEARNYCPGCEPGTDPLTNLVCVVYCGLHCPSIEGTATMPKRFRFLGDGDYFQTETGGDQNRRACDHIHRGEQ